MELNVNKACFCWHFKNIIDFVVARTRRKSLFDITSSHRTHRRIVPQASTFDATSVDLRQSRSLCFASVSRVRIESSLSTSSEHATTLFLFYYFPLAAAAAATLTHTLAYIRTLRAALCFHGAAHACVFVRVCVVCFHSYINHMIMASSSLKVLRFTSKICVMVNFIPDSVWIGIALIAKRVECVTFKILSTNDKCMFLLCLFRYMVFALWPNV